MLSTGRTFKNLQISLLIKTEDKQPTQAERLGKIQENN